MIQTTIKDHKLITEETPPHIRITVEYIVPFEFTIESASKKGKTANITWKYDDTCLKRFRTHIDNFVNAEKSILSKPNTGVLT